MVCFTVCVCFVSQCVCHCHPLELSSHDVGMEERCLPRSWEHSSAETCPGVYDVWTPFIYNIYCTYVVASAEV